MKNQQKSLAGNSKKRKILLGTLIPLVVTGTSLGAALSITACSCSNDDAIVFNNASDLQSYCLEHTNNLLTDLADIDMNWSSADVDNAAMLDWFNTHMDNQTFGLTYACASAGALIFPATYIPSVNGMKFIFSLSMLGDCSMSYERSLDYTYTITTTIGSNSPTTINGKIIKIGTAPGTGRRLIITNGFDWPSSIWPSVQFPSGNPNT